MALVSIGARPAGLDPSHWVFSLQLSYAAPTDSFPRRTLIRGVESLTGARSIQRLYDGLAEVAPCDLYQGALDALAIEVDFDGHPLETVLAHGPLVLLGNHPFGVLDGLILCAVAARLRKDFRVLTNSVLCFDERIREHLLPIDFAETREAQRINVSTKRTATDTLRRGGLVALFPAGAVSTATSTFGHVVDLEWKSFVAKLVRGAEATVLPLYFHGQNGRLFQWVSQFSSTLRLSLLLRELNRRRGQRVRVTVGMPIRWSELSEIRGRKELTERLRSSVAELGAQPPSRLVARQSPTPCS